MRNRFFAVVLCAAAALVMALSAASAEAKLKLSETDVQLQIRRSTRITASVKGIPGGETVQYSWSSDNEEVATVKGGTVTAVSGGSATVTCEAVLKDGTTLTAGCEVTVSVPVTGFRLDSQQMTVRIGKPETIGYTLTPADPTNGEISWTSENEEVATVSSDGVVTAVAPGTARIRGETADGSGKRVVANIFVPSFAEEQQEYTMSDLGDLDIPVTCYVASL